MKKNVVVVIGGGINGLGIVRNIGRFGIDVICVVEKKDFACKSRYISSIVVNPKLSTDPKSILDSLKVIHETYDYNKLVIFPVSDQSVYNIAINIHELNANFLVNIPDLKNYRYFN